MQLRRLLRRLLLIRQPRPPQPAIRRCLPHRTIGRDGETKVTIQQKGHSRIDHGATIEVGIEPGAAIAFDGNGLRL